jgi:prepilin-type processing-associated H-X9-DG protein
MGVHPAYGWLMLDLWKETLAPFVSILSDEFTEREQTMRVLRCPQLVRNEQGTRGHGQYACNASGTARFRSPANLGIGGYDDGRLSATAESRVRMPADMIALGDVAPGPTAGTTFFTSGYFDVCSSDRTFWPGSGHRGQANLLFCDGHIESGKQTNWTAPLEQLRRRWNNDNEPHSETWGRP